VTYSNANITIGIISIKYGPTVSPNGSRKGTFAKLKYPTVPITKEQGNANFLKKIHNFIIV